MRRLYLGTRDSRSRAVFEADCSSASGPFESAVSTFNSSGVALPICPRILIAAIRLLSLIPESPGYANENRLRRLIVDSKFLQARRGPAASLVQARRAGSELKRESRSGDRLRQISRVRRIVKFASSRHVASRILPELGSSAKELGAGSSFR